MLHDELKAVFDEHQAPTHASKRDVHATLADVMKVVSRAQHQIHEYRALLTQAEMAPHDHRVDGKLEAMHQTLGAGERDVAALAQTARNVALVFTQLDRYMVEWQADIAAATAAAEKAEKSEKAAT